MTREGGFLLALLVCLGLVACAADQPSNTVEALGFDKRHGIKLPELGAKYLAKCDHGLCFSGPSDAIYTYQLVDTDTLRIEIWRNERLSRIEIPALGYGIDVVERKNLYNEGYRVQRHEISTLDNVRRARAEGKVYEREAGNWFECDFDVEVLDERAIDHASLGERLVIPLHSSRSWVGGGQQNEYIAYVEARTREVVRTFSVPNHGLPMTCDFTML
jgi:hypothetical protein